MLKKLFVTKPDDILHTCKLRVCKFPKNSMDVNYMNLRTCTVVIHTILWKFATLWLTSPSGPIRYTILIDKNNSNFSFYDI